MKLLDELNATYRGRPVLGGLVSGGNAAGEHLLFLEGEVYNADELDPLVRLPRHVRRGAHMVRSWTAARLSTRGCRADRDQPRQNTFIGDRRRMNGAARHFNR